MFPIKVNHSFIMNYFFSLPNDIKSHIYFFIKTSSANSIISSWKRYICHKKFTIYSIYSLPKFNSFIDNDLIYSVVFKNTYFFFKKLYNITTGTNLISLIYIIVFIFWPSQLTIMNGFLVMITTIMHTINFIAFLLL